jgi:hypothetical protein
LTQQGPKPRVVLAFLAQIDWTVGALAIAKARNRIER